MKNNNIDKKELDYEKSLDEDNFSAQKFSTNKKTFDYYNKKRFTQREFNMKMTKYLFLAIVLTFFVTIFIFVFYAQYRFNLIHTCECHGMMEVYNMTWAEAVR